MSSSQTPTLAQVILNAIETRLTGLHTMMPGKVVKVDVANGKCDVQPLIQRIGPDGEPVTLPVIPNCPIGFYRAGKAAVYLPLAVDHLVEIRFCERSLDIWLTKGGTVDPQDARKHNLSDAVVYPGLYDFTQAPTAADPDNLVIVNDQGTITMNPDGSIFLGDKSAGHKVGLADEIENRLQALESGLSSLNSNVSSFATTFDSHVHIEAGVDTGIPTSPPTSPATPPSPFNPDTSVIGSSKVKVVT